MTTAVGKVVFTRRYWKCTCGEGGSYAADALLGVEGQRWSKTLQKQGCRLSAATRVLAFAMIATAKEFRKSWRPRLRRLGVTSLSAVPALADGASWIWKAMDRVLTGCIQTLDFYHGCQHISKCAEGIFGEGTTEKRGRGRLITTRESGYTLPEPAVFDSTCVPRPLSL